MAIDIATLIIGQKGEVEGDRRGAGRWSAYAFHLPVLAGAATVVAGSYATWATFYAGLIARNGVDGHGKYFIGLAAASVLAAALSTRTGVSRALTLLIVPAAGTIAVMALRDVHNFNSFAHDPAAGFYVPAMGNGLYVVLAGAVLLAGSVLAQASLPSLRPFDGRRTAAALAAVIGVALLVPGLYGEYYLQIAQHVHGGANLVTSPHTLTIAGGITLFTSGRIALTSLPRRTVITRTR